MKSTKLVINDTVTVANVNTKSVGINAVEAYSNKITFSFSQLPDSMVDMAEYIRVSDTRIDKYTGKEKGGKVMPVGDGKLTLEYTMDDGSTSTIDFVITAWLNKNHVGAALEAQAKKIEEAARLEDEAKKLKALQSLTPDVVKLLVEAGIIK
jgi:hypothetical protein